jgi:hypothetical protein
MSEMADGPIGIVDGRRCRFVDGYVVDIATGNSGSFATRDAILAAARLIEQHEQMERSEQEEERAERGMLPQLCEPCGLEIPENSAYAFDSEDAFYMCAACAEDMPEVSDDE